MAEILRASHVPAPCLTFPVGNIATAIIFQQSYRLLFSHEHGPIPGLATTQLVMH